MYQVREAVTILDLDVAYYPCPAGGPTWRQKVKQKGGKASFPYMVDPNTGIDLMVAMQSKLACLSGSPL